MKCFLACNSVIPLLSLCRHHSTVTVLANPRANWQSLKDADPLCDVTRDLRVRQKNPEYWTESWVCQVHSRSWREILTMYVFSLNSPEPSFCKRGGYLQSEWKSTFVPFSISPQQTDVSDCRAAVGGESGLFLKCHKPSNPRLCFASERQFLNFWQYFQHFTCVTKSFPISSQTHIWPAVTVGMPCNHQIPFPFSL